MGISDDGDDDDGKMLACKLTRVNKIDYRNVGRLGVLIHGKSRSNELSH